MLVISRAAACRRHSGSHARRVLAPWRARYGPIPSADGGHRYRRVANRHRLSREARARPRALAIQAAWFLVQTARRQVWLALLDVTHEVASAFRKIEPLKRQTISHSPHFAPHRSNGGSTSIGADRRLRAADFLPRRHAVRVLGVPPSKSVHRITALEPLMLVLSVAAGAAFLVSGAATPIHVAEIQDRAASRSRSTALLIH